MENAGDEKLKRELSFDLYSRYAIIRDIVNENRDGGERISVLDVGGRGNLMKKFLPDDDVFYMDPYVDTEDDNYIEGDGCSIPLGDASYDYVVSSDVYEHILPEKRQTFLKENLRVARRAVILGAPFYTKERELAEKYANESYKVISRGDDHFWLIEHIRNGLPQAGEVEEMLTAGGYPFQRIPNNNLWLWEHLLCSSFVFLAAGKLDKTKEFNRYYNEKLYPHDHSEDSYRTIYFIKKDAGLKDLKLTDGGISTSLHLEAIKENFRLLSQVYLEDKELIEELKQLVQEKEIQVNRRDYELEEARRQLQEALEIIERIYASNSWKITEPARKVRPALRRLMRRDGQE